MIQYQGPGDDKPRIFLFVFWTKTAPLSDPKAVFHKEIRMPVCLEPPEGHQQSLHVVEAEKVVPWYCYASPLKVRGNKPPKIVMLARDCKVFRSLDLPLPPRRKLDEVLIQPSFKSI